MQNKIDKKYVVWIWLGLIFASFVRNVYNIYSDIAGVVGESAAKIALKVFYIILDYGIIETAVTYLVAFVAYIIMARRHANYLSRADFCYWVMIFASAEKLLAGIIDAFSLLSPTMHIVTSTILDVTLLPCAMLIMYLLIAKIYKFNPVEKYNSFSILSLIALVLWGLSVFSSNLTIVSIASGGEFSRELILTLNELGYDVSSLQSDPQVYSSITAMVVYGCYLIADIVITMIFKKQAGEYQGEDTREDFFTRHPSNDSPYQSRDDVYATFGNFDANDNHYNDDNDDDNNNDTVFDEFDI